MVVIAVGTMTWKNKWGRRRKREVTRNSSPAQSEIELAVALYPKDGVADISMSIESAKPVGVDLYSSRHDEGKL